jgi:Ydr279p protein triple barrel domain
LGFASFLDSLQLQLITIMNLSKRSRSDLLVALEDPEFSSSDPGGSYQIHTLPDPSTGEHRPYLVHVERDERDHRLCELTAVGPSKSTDEEYQSFAVVANGGGSSYVVGNGVLHTITTVDPLFWLLQDKYASTNEAPNKQWQPLDQYLQQFDAVLVQKCLDVQQCTHVLDEMVVEEETYVKFSVPKTVLWLQRKFDAVEAVLLKQMEAHRKAVVRKSRTQGAMAANFHLAQRPTPTQPKQSSPSDVQDDILALSAQDRQRAKYEAIQSVCNYLSAPWIDRLLEHVNETKKVALEEPAATTAGKKSPTSTISVPTEDWNAAIGDLVPTGEGNSRGKVEAVQEKPVTAGAKRLLKVNQKGLQKMSSFFSVKKSKTAEK